MARSLGDVALSKHGVIATPEVNNGILNHLALGCCRALYILQVYLFGGDFIIISKLFAIFESSVRLKEL